MEKTEPVQQSRTASNTTKRKVTGRSGVCKPKLISQKTDRNLLTLSAVYCPSTHCSTVHCAKSFAVFFASRFVPGGTSKRSITGGDLLELMNFPPLLSEYKPTANCPLSRLHIKIKNSFHAFQRFILFHAIYFGLLIFPY